MHNFIKVIVSACSLWLTASLYSQQHSNLSDLGKIIVTVSFDGADIRTVQEELNRNVPDFIFNLETDQRDVAEVTLHAENIPLPKLLNDICRTLRYEWAFDAANRSINLFPADIKRYAYYPFGLTIPAIEMRGGDMYDVFNSLQNSALLGEKYSFLVSIGENKEARKRWKRFEGTLESMTLRQAFNWICANSGRPICWRSGYSSPDLPTFGFNPKYAPQKPEEAFTK